MKVVSGYEVEQLSECFALFGEAYVPKLTVIVVQKRINTRLFQTEVIHHIMDYCSFRDRVIATDAEDLLKLIF